MNTLLVDPVIKAGFIRITSTFYVHPSKQEFVYLGDIDRAPLTRRNRRYIVHGYNSSLTRHRQKLASVLPPNQQ
jgi:hypothetical protein